MRLITVDLTAHQEINTYAMIAIGAKRKMPLGDRRRNGTMHQGARRTALTVNTKIVLERLRPSVMVSEVAERYEFKADHLSTWRTMFVRVIDNGSFAAAAGVAQVSPATLTILLILARCSPMYFHAIKLVDICVSRRSDTV
ncbi:hypothetical protein BBJ66_16115 [Rhizobium sp. RSm-3]|nr:hypothetical protein BBJ66_16115 [Rhizobium sp. RSm-3]